MSETPPLRYEMDWTLNIASPYATGVVRGQTIVDDNRGSMPTQIERLVNEFRSQLIVFLSTAEVVR